MMAIARLAVERPGWDYMLGTLIAEEIFQRKGMYDEFKKFKIAEDVGDSVLLSDEDLGMNTNGRPG